jgi:hypothetical protein
MDRVYLHGASGFGAASAELVGKPVVVGRSGDLRLEDDTIEKKHARFTLRDGKVFVAPMGSGAIFLGSAPLSGQTEVAPGDVVILAKFAAVFVAASPEQEPSRKGREAVDMLFGYQRDRVLVRLLELPSPKLVQLALEMVRAIPPLRLQAVEPLVRAALDALSRRADAPPKEQLEALAIHLAADKPKPAVFVEQEAAERRRAAEAARPPPPPLDEDADPEASARVGAPTRAWHLVPAEREVGHGFCFGAPPIDPSRWPRSPRDGAPMAHLGTLLVPAEYRVAGPYKIAIALFQADDHVRPRAPGAAGAVTPEGDATLLEDGIGGSYALLWLDAETFARGPGRGAPEGVILKTPQFLRLRARLGDPNVGKVIPDWDDDPGDYIRPDSEEGQALALDRFAFPHSRIRVHFGGTSFAVDNFARGLGPFYVAIEDDFGGANFGGGNAVLDLARQRIVFGC